MQKSKKKRWMIAVTLMMTAGCSRLDEQAIQQTLENQRRQNELVAQQSAAVVRAGDHLTEGAKELVRQDAAARQELMEAHSQTQASLQQERANLDRQKELLDGERRSIAQERRRDPIWAATVQGVMELLACLSPLVLAAYALRQLGQSSSHSRQFSELLLTEFTPGQPHWRLRSDEPTPLLR
jgi:hypothetical protein